MNSPLEKRPDGYWGRDGHAFAYYVGIKENANLGDEENVKNLRPGDVLEYEIFKIKRRTINFTDEGFFATVIKVDDPSQKNYLIPLCALDFSDNQKKEISKLKNISYKAFEQEIKNVEVKSEDDFTLRSAAYPPKPRGLHDLRH